MEDDDMFDPKSDPLLDWDPDLWDITKTTTNDTSWYRIDPSKIKTVKDIALLLDAINIKFQKTHTEFDSIAHLLKKEGEEE